MIKDLKIVDHEVLETLELYNLPQITIISGQNNSGKSTLLNYIVDASVDNTGKILTDEHIDIILQRSIISTSYADLFKNPVRVREYREVLEQAAKVKKIWFRTDSIMYCDEAEKHFNKNRNLSLHTFRKDVVVSIFETIIKNEIKPVLLPPKRTLDLQVGIDTDSKVKPAGRGILNFLFKSKNQPSNSDFRKLHDKIFRAFRTISGGFRFNVFVEEKNQIVLQFAKENGEWLPASKCGLGLQDLLVMLYYSETMNDTVICIEEPESHLHPDMQRRLLVHLKKSVSNQYFLTTHSNVFLNNTIIEKFLLTVYDGEKIIIKDDTKRAFLLADLGYSVSDNLVSDLVILTEGPSDVPVLKEFIRMYSDLEGYEIKIWPLGGDIMDKLDLDILCENYSLYCLIDKDPGSSKVRKRFAMMCDEKGIPYHKLKRYAIENYFTLEALRKVFGKQIPHDIERINPKIKLETQLRINVKSNNRKIVKHMTIEDIKNTDLFNFFENIASYCKRNLKSNKMLMRYASHEA